nr:LOW QUALITY PROTEIN: facilitated trehalose transporter Tret1-like [Cherax quadricarinatus]
MPPSVSHNVPPCLQPRLPKSSIRLLPQTPMRNTPKVSTPPTLPNPSNVVEPSFHTPLPCDQNFRTSDMFAVVQFTLGGLLMGTGIGYSSPAGPLLMSNSTEGGSLQLSEDQYNWFSSLMNLGALVGGVLGGFSINRLGRRFTMLVSGPIYLTGWALIGFGQNFATLVAGRMVVGACICATCVVVPTYVGEIASPDIRGILGTSYVYDNSGDVVRVHDGRVCYKLEMVGGSLAVPAVPYFLSVIFIHESHTFLLAKGKLEQATASLQHFRGKHYDVQKEINMIQQSLEDAKNNKPSLKEFLRPHNLKPFVLCLTIFVSIQMSGLGPVLFNMSFIFKASGADLDDNVSTAIVGVVQILATALSGVLVDKAGRKLLLIVSAATVSLSLC